MEAKYSKEQITAYFERISLPAKLWTYDVSGLDAKASLEIVKSLIKHHLTSVPFENLALHYSPHRTVVLHPEEVYRKIVTNRRGGYCMELNATFGCLLRSLGYTLYHVGARVNSSPTAQSFGPFNHMLNIVTIGSDRYLVDVGFGSNYVPTVPVRLINDATGFSNVPPASARLVFKAIEGAANPYAKLWVYQHRTGPDVNDGGWKDMYCFNADLEFRHDDFEMMNYWTSTSKKSIFTHKVICNKMIFGEGDQREDIVGTIGLMRELKRRVGKESTILNDFDEEKDRVDALKQHFGISLSEVEREAIRGTVDEIK
ncbi:uncharacterized protein PV09_06556 [Verruconis gallopava]|uniref:Uncharacterized protein n=1 Tax=Verruconis gallopava TaxID=253628 RepID=A0A0D1XID0_9PEZI|nr:uncharacterized protein PV09_06556 [Verruconis gallopava]KIW02056.1 hypothetical protein PV09_06556 [Verruconis gallopava]